MNLKEFQKLPIETVLIWEGFTSDYIEVKISKNITECVETYGYNGNINYIGDKLDYSKEYIGDLENLRIAPKWIADKFKVEGD